jgi:hypothetical protein
MSEETKKPHRIGVTYSDPNHMVQMFKTIKVPGDLDPDEARQLAKDHFGKKGHKVHAVNILGPKGTYMNVTSKQKADYEKRGAPIGPRLFKRKKDMNEDYKGIKQKPNKFSRDKVHINIKDGQPETDNDRNVLNFAKNSGDKIRVRYRGPKKGKRDTSKADATGAAVYRLRKEEAEPLQELSKKTLMSYMQKSENEYYKTDDKKKKTKRLQGVVRAGLAHRKKKDMNEETENLQELSKKAIGKYIDANRRKTPGFADYYEADGNEDEKKKLDATYDKRRKYLELARAKRNKSGKSDSAKAKVLAKEEVLNELSKSLLKRYTMKSHDRVNTGEEKPEKRENSRMLAYRKRTYKDHNQYVGGEKPKVLAKEETLNELSKKTLGRYIKGAVADVEYHAKEYGTLNDFTRGRKHFKTATKRTRGIHKATDKLTKEETENLQELSKGILNSYLKKSERSWEKAGKRDSSGNPRPGYRKVRDKRETGMATAMKKLAKESVSHIVESINNKEKKE